MTTAKLTGGSLSGLRDSGCQVLSQVLPYSETVTTLIRRFSSEPAERLVNSKVDGEFLGQHASGLPDDNSDSDDGPSQGNGIIDAFKKLNETKGRISRSSIPKMDCNGDTKLQDKTYRPYLFQIVLDAPSNSLRTVLDKWIEDGNHLERNEVMLVLFHLRKQRLYWKALQKFQISMHFVCLMGKWAQWTRLHKELN